MNCSPPPHANPWSAPGWQHGRLRPDASLPVTAEQRLVLKIGGSLLSRSDWPRLLAALVAAVPPAPLTLVIGGGAVVDGLRRIDAAAPQPPAVMHALAIEAMRVTARLVATALGLPLSTSPTGDRAAVVLDAPAWLGADPRGRDLPPGWHVTSDSIAATVAARMSASLLLAKTLPPPRRPGPDSGDLAALAAAAWVDDHFPVAAAGLSAIEWAAPR
jgi:hypothetical protein